MGLANQMTVKDLGELALFLYDQGDAAFQQGNLLHASIWFAQCLSVFEQLHTPNAIWIAALMLSLGKIAMQVGQLEQAASFLQACTDICAQLPEDDVVRDYRTDLAVLGAKVSSTSTTLKPTHDFLIVAGNIALKKIRVTPTGEIQWTVLTDEQTAPPIKLGLNTSWKVVASH